MQSSGASPHLLLGARRCAGPAGANVEAPPRPCKEHLPWSGAQQLCGWRRNLHGPGPLTPLIPQPGARAWSACTSTPGDHLDREGKPRGRLGQENQKINVGARAELFKKCPLRPPSWPCPQHPIDLASALLRLTP
ncbi:hypothetical protein NDU88_004844 [Pleurodeles waltl]|uniref:Uncharacterized protein n=1 Tax=Pleurodeles waltl TaxID=8319 RepID=A0AAV7L0K6_PLEWA|nr:hypothetical protein NDU88_004844 [Pleurodeles waltl]